MYLHIPRFYDVMCLASVLLLKPFLGCLIYCTMFGVPEHFTPRVYVTYHFWTPICYVLSYWRHRSVCYTSLFTTSLVATIISVLQCVMTLWRCVSERFFDLFCYLFGDLSSVSLFSSLLSLSLSLSSLLLSLLSVFCVSPILSVYLLPLK
jgi:hypothetical protein